MILSRSCPSSPGFSSRSYYDSLFQRDSLNEYALTLNYFLHRNRIAPDYKPSSLDRLQLVLFYFYHTALNIC